MPLPAQERLTLIRVKIERAKKHIDDLDVACNAFFTTQPNIIRFEIDPKAKQRTYYVGSIRDIPSEIAAITGDALNNIRSALDHLAYQLVDAAGATSTVQTSFPIYDSPEKYKTDFVRKIKGMRQDAIDAIDAIRPYKGGNDALWRLHSLNNIDKHRLLITVSMMNSSHSMTPSQKAEVTKRFRGSMPSDPLPNLVGIHIASPMRNIPLKTGDALLTIPESEVEQYMQFRFHVAFAEHQIIEGYSVVETLKQMADLVDNIVSSFAPLLK